MCPSTETFVQVLSPDSFRLFDFVGLKIPKFIRRMYFNFVFAVFKTISLAYDLIKFSMHSFEFRSDLILLTIFFKVDHEKFNSLSQVCQIYRKLKSSSELP